MTSDGVPLYKVFSLEAGEELKATGMKKAVDNPKRKEMLALAKKVAVDVGKRQTRVSADDVFVEMEHLKLDFSILGPASGSIFSDKRWVFTGHWEKSIRASNHGRYNRVWTLCD